MTIGLKAKIGLGFLLAFLFLVTLIIFGNLVKIQPVPAIGIPMQDQANQNNEALQKIAESNRYYNPISYRNETGQIVTARENNLTNSIAAQLSQIIIDKNPLGPTEADGQRAIKTPLIEDSLPSLVDTALGNFDFGAFRPEIKKGDLKIIGNSQDSFDYYLSSLQQTLKKNFASASENINQVIDQYKKALPELYQLPVPEQLAAFHQKEIGLITSQKLAFESLSQYEADPLKAIMAVRYLSGLNEEFDSLKRELDELTKNNSKNP